MFFVFVFVCFIFFSVGMFFYFKFVLDVFEISEAIKSINVEDKSLVHFKGASGFALAANPKFLFSILLGTTISKNADLFNLIVRAKRNYWIGVKVALLGVFISVVMIFLNIPKS